VEGVVIRLVSEVNGISSMRGWARSRSSFREAGLGGRDDERPLGGVTLDAPHPVPLDQARIGGEAAAVRRRAMIVASPPWNAPDGS
jgi:hypothetical protein